MWGSAMRCLRSGRAWPCPTRFSLRSFASARHQGVAGKSAAVAGQGQAARSCDGEVAIAGERPGIGACTGLVELDSGVIDDIALQACRVADERARGDGITWEQIGEALGLDQGSAGRSGCDLGVGGSGYDLGVGAFEYFTGGPDPWYRASFRFCCASCGGYITDRGPFENYPEDNEHGHAEGCVRLAADIAGWHAQQDAWEAGGWPVTLTVTQR